MNHLGQFMYSDLGEHGLGQLPISRGVFQQGMPHDIERRLADIQRGEFGGQDPAEAMAALQIDLMRSIQRAQTSSGVPIREDLEAPATLIVPLDTPLRNRLPRTLGSGTGSSWYQETSLGSGYGVATTVTTGATSATQTVGSTSGMRPGMSLFFATTNTHRIVSSVTDATTVVLTATITTTTAEVVSAGPYFQPDQNPVQVAFGESGAPATAKAVYAKITKGYALLGTLFSITGLAMAAGASFGNQLAEEKTAAIRRLMLAEENMLFNSDSTVVAPPYGDGASAFGFDGMLVSIASANGTPVSHIQTSVGALTTTHIDAQLSRIHNQGSMDPYIECNAQEAQSLTHLAEASGSIIRIEQSADKLVLGGRVAFYMHPITGQMVPIEVSRFVPAGTIVFGSDRGPDGKTAADVRVLPQVQMPEIAPNVNIQGYTAQELAPTTAAPQVYPGIVSVYEVFRMKNAKVFAKSTGVTAV